jgi:protein-S-isoprenylcysteine O-methyltransferase Ste14
VDKSNATHPSRLTAPRIVTQVLVFVFLIPLLPLLISRHWDWWEAWIFAILNILGFILSRFLAAQRHPDLLAERARIMRHENTEPWDRVLAPILSLATVLILVAAGLDELLGWSPPFSLPAKAIALVLILAGYWLGSYALIENRFFSGVVRLQPERGQQVVSSGPYRWIRHPGYAGGLLVYLVTPIFLDASWAFIPAAVLAVTLILRTGLEDRLLHEQLEGYRAYAQKVRYRLLPGVW